MGSLSNWEYVVQDFQDEYEVHVPLLPVLDENKGNKLDYLVDFIHQYIQQNKIFDCVLIGNSLGGHLAVLYSYRYSAFVKGLVLTGSSGLYENSMIDRFPRRHDYSYIKERVEYTFYNSAIANESLVKDVFEIVNDNRKCFQIIKAAKTAQRNYVTEELKNIQIPVLLIWGLQDKITPPAVAKEFSSLLQNADLKFIDNCGHVPMMEEPEIFNDLLSMYLDKLENNQIS
jgi:pimeloyl-ACP methyl ester carboxylesterase